MDMPTLRMVATPTAPSFAREVVAYRLALWQLEQVADTAALIVSELVTNAVRAAGLSEKTPSWKLGQRDMIELAMRYVADEEVAGVGESAGENGRLANGKAPAQPGGSEGARRLGVLLVAVHDRLPGKPETQYPEREPTTREHGREPMLAPYQRRGRHGEEPWHGSEPEHGRRGQEEGPEAARERSRDEHGQREQDGPGEGTPRGQGQPGEQDGSGSLDDFGDASPAIGDAIEDSLREHGRGLLLVEQLSEAWGWWPTQSGKVVWCRVAVLAEDGDVTSGAESKATDSGRTAPPLPRRRPGETEPQATRAEPGWDLEGMWRVLVGLRRL